MKRRGFTLLEVMVAIALLGLALTVLMKSAAGNIFNAEQAHMLGIATDLARGKMYDIEEQLMKDGFTDTDQSQLDPKAFEDEGWPTIRYAYKVEAVEMPSFDELQQLAQGHGKLAGSNAGFGSGSGSAGSAFAQALGSAALYGSDYAGLGSDSLNGFQNSALGGMLNMMGGGGIGGSTGLGSAKDIGGAQGGALIQAQYTMFQQILKVSVRKVSLTVTYKVLGSDRELKLVAFFTDPQAMDIVLNGLGSIDLGDTSNGSGSGSGSAAIVKTSTSPATTTK